MRSARLLIPLLVAATVLVDLVVFSVLLYDEAFPRQWPHPAGLLFYSLPLSQVSLVALWTGFGGKSLPWRIMGLVLAIVAWSTVLGIVGEAAGSLWPAREIRSLWIVSLVPQTIPIVAALWVARLKWVMLVQTSNATPMQHTVSDRPRFQFSLRHLFSWITALAVVMGLLQYTVDSEVAALVASQWRSFPAWCAASLAAPSALALVALWAALGARRVSLRIIAMAVTIVAAVFAENTPGQRLLSDAAYYILKVVWLLTSLYVVRVAGYRVVRRARAGLEEPPVLEVAE